jgi:hypothetical protein
LLIFPDFTFCSDALAWLVFAPIEDFPVNPVGGAKGD